MEYHYNISSKIFNKAFLPLIDSLYAFDQNQSLQISLCSSFVNINLPSMVHFYPVQQ